MSLIVIRVASCSLSHAYISVNRNKLFIVFEPVQLSNLYFMVALAISFRVNSDFG